MGLPTSREAHGNGVSIVPERPGQCLGQGEGEQGVSERKERGARDAIGPIPKLRETGEPCASKGRKHGSERGGGKRAVRHLARRLLYNTLRKALPDAFGKGIEGTVVCPVQVTFGSVSLARGASNPRCSINQSRVR